MKACGFLGRENHCKRTWILLLLYWVIRWEFRMEEPLLYSQQVGQNCLSSDIPLMCKKFDNSLQPCPLFSNTSLSSALITESSTSNFSWCNDASLDCFLDIQGYLDFPPLRLCMSCFNTYHSASGD